MTSTDVLHRVVAVVAVAFIWPTIVLVSSVPFGLLVWAADR